MLHNSTKSRLRTIGKLHPFDIKALLKIFSSLHFSKIVLQPTFGPQPSSLPNMATLFYFLLTPSVPSSSPLPSPLLSILILVGACPLSFSVACCCALVSFVSCSLYRALCSELQQTLSSLCQPTSTFSSAKHFAAFPTCRIMLGTQLALPSTFHGPKC